MTRLPSDVPPAAVPTVPSELVAQLSSADAGPRPVVDGLPAMIVAGLRALDDLRHPGLEVTSGHLERILRSGVTDHQRRAVPTEPDPLARVATSVRVACAHLDAGNLVDARLALRGAYDALPHRDQDGAGGDASGTEARARTVSTARRRDLSTRVVLAQAAGVLAGHTGAGPADALAALHRYAERHRFEVSELAGDLVAGRVAPAAVADGSTVDVLRPGTGRPRSVRD